VFTANRTVYAHWTIRSPGPSTGGSGSNQPGNTTNGTSPDEPTAPPNNPYSDVANTEWFFEAVCYVTEKGLMTGTGEGKFSPNITMSRAMLVTVLHRLDGSPAVSGSIPFSDVKSGQWYSAPILWASKDNIVGGYPDGTFGLNDSVTREQAVTFLHRYAIAKGLKDTNAAANLSGYTDAGQISGWALDAMKWAVAFGIIQGRTATTLAPQGTSTRAEVATMLKRFVDSLSNVG